MYYQIKLIGERQVPRKPWLALGMGGNYSFGNIDYAHKFSRLDSAKYILEDVNAKSKRAFITWHDDSADAPFGAWGEVNQSAL